MYVEIHKRRSVDVVDFYSRDVYGKRKFGTDERFDELEIFYRYYKRAQYADKYDDRCFWIIQIQFAILRF